MYEYEMSEKLFLDIWEKYECPEEVSDPLTIYNILNDMILSILVDTFISKISFPMQPGPEIGSISDA